MKKVDLDTLECLSKEIQQQKKVIRTAKNKEDISSLRTAISKNIHNAHEIIDAEDNLNIKEMLRLRFIHALSWKQISTKMYFLQDDAEKMFAQYKNSLE